MILSVFALSAQRYTVTETGTGNVVESGATYHIWDDGSAAYGYPGGPLQISFDITAIHNCIIIGGKIENNVVPGTTNDFCMGQCFMPSVYESPATILEEGGEPLEFSMHYLADNYLDVLGQEQSMTYYIYEEGNPEEKFFINVIFVYSLDIIDDYSSAEVFSNAYPMPARDVVNFDYNFATSVIGEVAIFNMMGQEVMRSEISGMQGKASINVSDLADGIYFYSLIINGKTEKSNKLIIRK